MCVPVCVCVCVCVLAGVDIPSKALSKKAKGVVESTGTQGGGPLCDSECVAPSPERQHAAEEVDQTLQNP